MLLHSNNGLICCSVLFFTFLLFFEFGLSGGASVYSKEQIFCGKKLVESLSKLCATYNSPYKNEASEERDYSGAGIIQLCCVNPCSYRVLSQFCATLKAEAEKLINS